MVSELAWHVKIKIRYLFDMTVRFGGYFACQDDGGICRLFE